MPLMIGITPIIVNVIADQRVADFARKHGFKRDDLSTLESEVYELETRSFSQFYARTEEIHAASRGMLLLPEILVVGLISAYDGFLASLLKVVISDHEGIVLTSQKQITYKDLREFKSIEEARSALIEREIDSVMRLSHHDQFDWMQDHLSIKLKEGLDIWPTFVELCERRNLFTHTAGIITNQYLKVCSDHRCTPKKIAVGQRLGVPPEYFRLAVEAIYEVGLKLCYVFWRKFKPDESQKADIAFNGRCMELISGRQYKLAETLLMFSHKVPKLKDDVRRMMIVNLANAIRLQKRQAEAKKLLDSIDWSATTDEFKLCIASITGDLDEVLKLMERLGNQENPEKYRDWPVFRITRDDTRFVDKFEAIYGEPFLLAKPTTVNDTDNVEGTASGSSTPAPPEETLH